MGEIIKFPGSWHGPENEPVKSEHAHLEEESVKLDLDKMEGLINILKSLRGRSGNTETRATFATLVKSYPPQEIADRINNYNEMDVVRRPAFFHALLDEVERRREEF